MNAPLRRVHLLIEGRVQGVGYRWWFETRARDHGLAGWVRNRRDGTVEADIQGLPEAVASAIQDAGNGPPPARVSRVDVTDRDVDPSIVKFSRLPTA